MYFDNSLFCVDIDVLKGELSIAVACYTKNVCTGTQIARFSE